MWLRVGIGILSDSDADARAGKARVKRSQCGGRETSWIYRSERLTNSAELLALNPILPTTKYPTLGPNPASMSLVYGEEIVRRKDSKPK